MQKRTNESVFALAYRKTKPPFSIQFNVNQLYRAKRDNPELSVIKENSILALLPSIQGDFEYNEINDNQYIIKSGNSCYTRI